MSDIYRKLSQKGVCTQFPSLSDFVVSHIFNQNKWAPICQVDIDISFTWTCDHSSWMTGLSVYTVPACLCIQSPPRTGPKVQQVQCQQIKGFKRVINTKVWQSHSFACNSQVCQLTVWHSEGVQKWFPIWENGPNILENLGKIREIGPCVFPYSEAKILLAFHGYYGDMSHHHHGFI